jgi:hypothetical protein
MRDVAVPVAVDGGLADARRKKQHTPLFFKKSMPPYAYKMEFLKIYSD